MSKQQIHDVQELAAAISMGDGIESVSRAVYKGTDCGAWVDEHAGGTIARIAPISAPWLK